MSTNIETKAIHAIRILSADGVEKANSGHPGLPLGAAAMAYTLFAKEMKHNPKNPAWINRDRFVLSAGHGSMLLYSLLHLFGYGDLSIEELKNFRQLDSLTPGHPEYRHTAGVEATTGPLGAGMAMAVGMAMAEAHLADTFNEKDFPVIDHYTFVLGGDGCLMEGISSETFSLAGTLGLHKLIVLYDSNSISIEGSTDLAFTEDPAKRMESFGFQTLTVEDGNDTAAVARAIEEAKADKLRPSFITVKTTIGYGCPPKEGKASAHGEPLGKENVALLRKHLGWEWEEPFFVPREVYSHYSSLADSLAKDEQEWNALFASYEKAHPDKKELWNRYFGEDEKELLNDEAYWEWDDKADATRNISGKIINRLKTIYPNLIGGSADLAPSNKTVIADSPYMERGAYGGRNIHFGVRELSMAGETNGILLHGGLKAFCATFFVFSDYLKPMARLAALMELPAIYVLTHDSIGVGEDGPTHEPVEQLAMLRAMPNFHVFRPADATETLAAWYSAITSKRTPTALVLTRQNLPQLAGSSREALKGGYILRKEEKPEPDCIVIASGSEVHLAVEAARELLADGIDVRVVSLPSSDVFDSQTKEYKESVLPLSVRKRVAIEALSTFGLEKYTGLDGAVIGMESFGASGPQQKLFEKFGITKDKLKETIRQLI